MTPVSVLQSASCCDWLRSADREAPMKLGGTANPFAPKDMVENRVGAKGFFYVVIVNFNNLLRSGGERK